MNICGLFDAKAILDDDTIQSIAWEDKRLHDFPKRTSSKVNVITRLEFEHAYYDVVVKQGYSLCHGVFCLIYSI